MPSTEEFEDYDNEWDDPDDACPHGVGWDVPCPACEEEDDED